MTKLNCNDRRRLAKQNGVTQLCKQFIIPLTNIMHTVTQEKGKVSMYYEYVKTRNYDYRFNKLKEFMILKQCTVFVVKFIDIVC